MADLDHRLMTPPSLRVSEQRSTPSGDHVFQWDLRIAQPNVSHIDMPIIHSIEHFLGTYLREHPAIATVAPMGCQTGFYIVSIGLGEFSAMADLLAQALKRVGSATEVPLANPIQCGWAENHTLEGAQRLAAWLLHRREKWLLPGGAA